MNDDMDNCTKAGIISQRCLAMQKHNLWEANWKWRLFCNN